MHALQIKNENLNYQEALWRRLPRHRSRCRREFEKINFAGGVWGRAEGQAINGNHKNVGIFFTPSPRPLVNVRLIPTIYLVMGQPPLLFFIANVIYRWSLRRSQASKKEAGWDDQEGGEEGV